MEVPYQMSCDLLQSLKLNDGNVVGGNGAAATSSTTTKEQLMKEYEAIMNDPKMAEALSNKIYSRELIQLVRDINKISQIVPCPMNEEALRHCYIDRDSMPSPMPVLLNKHPNPITNTSKIEAFLSLPGNQEKMDEYLADPTNAKDFLNKIYNKELLVMLPTKAQYNRLINGLPLHNSPGYGTKHEENMWERDAWFNEGGSDFERRSPRTFYNKTRRS